MLNNILAVSEELKAQGYPLYIDIPEAALYALLGFVFVFIGIAFLIGIVQAVGKAMQMKNGVTPKKEPVKPIETKDEKPNIAPVANEDEVSEETIAVITAALMAYYEQTNPKCEFTVRRIKRI